MRLLGAIFNWSSHRVERKGKLKIRCRYNWATDEVERL